MSIDLLGFIICYDSYCFARRSLPFFPLRVSPRDLQSEETLFTTMSVAIVMPKYISCLSMSVLSIIADTPAGSSDNEGEYFSMAVAERKAAVAVHESDIVIVPLSFPIGHNPLTLLSLQGRL